MTRVLPAALVAMAGATIWASGGAPTDPAGANLLRVQQPVFRTGTELVRVDVLVTDDGGPVTGLTASDFEVRDSGVRQRITAAGALEAVQLGVVLDASGSMTGERLDIARAAISSLLNQLTPGDRFSVVAFGDEVTRLAGGGTSVAAADAAIGRAQTAGGTALLDGIYAGILEADGGPGPKLVLVMTDGRNNASWLRARDVVDTARRRETVIYPVAVGAEREWTGTITPRLRTSDALALLRVMAEETGGRHVEADWNAGLAPVFQQILREYRQRYILTFTPEGVGTRDGWHSLEVKVNRRGARVRARTGYWAGGA